MLSQTLEYALRAVVFLAKAAPRTRTTEEIAREMHIPQAYLKKILQNLSGAGIVRTRRGNRGGVALARHRQDLTILDVVNAVAPIGRTHSCPLGLHDHRDALCPLHKRLDKAMAMVEDAFRKTTLSEVMTESTEDHVLSAVPFDKP